MTDVQNLLVRSANGGWEKLEPQTTMPEGGITEIFGDDLGQVLGYDLPVVVAASNPQLSGGSPDALCVNGQGDVAIVTMALSGGADQALSSMLAHAGSMHGMAFEDFEKVCNRAGSNPGDLTKFVANAYKHEEFHGKSFEAGVANSLASGRFQFIAIVGDAPNSMVQSMRFLNANGAADVQCFEVASFASNTVTAVQVNPVDVGQKQQPTVMKMTGAGMIAVTERLNGETAGKLMSQLQKFCTANFDGVHFKGDNGKAEMSAQMNLNGEDVEVLHTDSTGAVTIRFDAIAPHDRDWTVRAELVQGMGRLLGTDLGDARKISQLHLTIEEHLNDATLMESLTETLADTLPLLRHVANDGIVGVAETKSTRIAS